MFIATILKSNWATAVASTASILSVYFSLLACLLTVFLFDDLTLCVFRTVKVLFQLHLSSCEGG